MTDASTVMLILTIIMPADVPDKIHHLDEPTIEQCWIDAQEFVAHRDKVLADVNEHGAVGVGAACGVIVKGDKT